MAKGKKRKGLLGLFGQQKPEGAERSSLSLSSKPTALASAQPHAAATSTTSALPAAPKLNEGAIFEIVLNGSPREEAVVPQGTLAEPANTADGNTVLRLSGGHRTDLPTAAGRTGGYSIRVPDSLEAAASGKRVRVTVNARAARGRETAEFSLAYSTNEVGNSNWRKFTVGLQFEPKSFEFDVPPMKNGNGDYVGILPANGPGVEVTMLKVEVIPRG
jgi:hypothetical protein